MKPPTPPVILDCEHVELRDGHCATTDCPNYVGIHESWNYVLPEKYRR